MEKETLRSAICVYSEYLTDLVDHIKIYENGNISVHFKFADEFRRIAEYIEINTTDTAEAGCPRQRKNPFDSAFS